MTTPETPLEILRRLVAIPSVSSVSNLPLIEWVAASLRPLGWSVRVIEWTDEQGIAKANLLAFAPGPGSQPDPQSGQLAFVCHTDTVPPAVGWRDPCTLRVADGHAHGLGACDVKAALACFLAAVTNLPRESVQSGLALLLTADEEIGCKGMDRLLAAEPGLRFVRAIVSEPTRLCPAVAGKGYGLARVTVRGREAHSAFPNEGVSAIAAAAQLIPHILTEPDAAYHAAADAATHPLFDPPTTTFNIGTLAGGTAKNIIPGECSFLVEWRAVPTEPTGAVPARLRRILAAAQVDLAPGITVALEPLRDEPGFDRAAAAPLADHLSAALRRPLTGISFGSEATRVARIAREVVVIGPGDMHTAHSDRECVPVAELDEWTHILRDLFRRAF